MTNIINKSVSEQVYDKMHSAVTNDFTAVHDRDNSDVVTVTDTGTDDTYTVTLDAAHCSCDADTETICEHLLYVVLDPDDEHTEPQHRVAQALRAYQDELERQLRDVQKHKAAIDRTLAVYDDKIRPYDTRQPRPGELEAGLSALLSAEDDILSE